MNASEARPLFVLYQLLEVARDTHDRGLHLGDITLSHLFIDEALYLSLLPSIQDNLLKPEFLHSIHESDETRGSLVTEGFGRQSRRENYANRPSMSVDAMQYLLAWESERTFDRHDGVRDRSCVSQYRWGNTSSPDNQLPVLRRGRTEHGDTLSVRELTTEHSRHPNEVNQVDRRLTEYQKLISSEEAFDVLKKVRNQLKM